MIILSWKSNWLYLQNSLFLYVNQSMSQMLDIFFENNEKSKV